jgi:DNA repair exonuclease SbcCD ATPase subunit
MSLPLRLVAPLIAAALLACTGVYYDTMERFGMEKRDILRDRVEAGRDDQMEAEEQFQTAYERFKEASGYDGGDLEAVYDDLSTQLARSEEKAEAVRDRIDSIEQVAADLFEEWEAEIGQIQSADLRRRSERSLRDTRSRYQQLIAAMRRAESRMEPVLAAFRDQVLFLKHNLNARAISSLQGNVVAIEDDVAKLIAEIQDSIREADRFIGSLED